MREARRPAAPEAALGAVLAENEALRARLRESVPRADHELEVGRLKAEVERLRLTAVAADADGQMMPRAQHVAEVAELSERNRRLLAEIQACAGGRVEELRQAAAQERLRHEAEAAGLRGELAAMRRLLEDAVPRAIFDEQMQGMAGEIARLQRALDTAALPARRHDELCGHIDEALALLDAASLGSAGGRPGETETLAAFCGGVKALAEEVLPGALRRGSRGPGGLAGDLERIERLVDEVIERAEQVLP